MADQKISELIEKTIPVANDLLAIVDSEAVPIETKKIKTSNITKIHAADDDAHHAVHLKTLVDHPLAIIPTMDDAHIPAGIARDAECIDRIATHAAKIKGIHGTGADFVAIAEDAQYVAASRIGDIHLGQNFFREGDTNALIISGGRNLGATLYKYGKDHITFPGHFLFSVPNAALAATKYPIIISGATDNPEVYPFNDNETDLGRATNKWRHVYTHGLTHDQLNITDKKCSKCGKKFKVGDMWAYSVIKLSGDFTVKRPKIVKKLHNPDLPATRKVHKLNEWTGKYEDVDEIVKVKIKRKHYYEHDGKIIEHEIEEEIENEYQAVEGEVEMPTDGFMTCIPVCKKCFLKE